MALNDRPILCRGALVLGLVASFALAGCGRKGDLEPPPKAGVTNGTTATSDASGATGDQSQQQSANTPIDKPDRHFILDPLL